MNILATSRGTLPIQKFVFLARKSEKTVLSGLGTFILNKAIPKERAYPF